MDHDRLVAVGSFCWNAACADYGQVGQGNIRRFGFTRAGIQRYQCGTCKATFTATKGTIFYNCHTPQETIIEVLSLLGERISLAAIHRTKGIKEETVVEWLRKAGQHVEEIEAVLLANYQMTRAQLDAMWTYVGHKGEKGGTQRKKNMGHFGEARRLIVIPGYA